MRVTNKNVIPFFDFLNQVIAFVIFGSVFLIMFPIKPLIAKIGSPYTIISISILSVFIVYLITPKIFEYISEGDTIAIKKKDAKVWRKYIRPREEITQFKKEKIKGYKIRKNPFFINLDIYVEDPDKINGISRHTFRASYLNHEEFSNLKKSLFKLIKKREKREKELSPE